MSLTPLYCPIQANDQSCSMVKGKGYVDDIIMLDAKQRLEESASPYSVVKYDTCFRETYIHTPTHGLDVAVCGCEYQCVVVYL